MNYKEMIENEKHTELLEALEKDGNILPSDPEEKMAYLMRRIIKTDKISVDIKRKSRAYLLEHNYIKESTEIPVTILEFLLIKSNGYKSAYPDFEKLVCYDCDAIIVIVSPKQSFIAQAINTRLFPAINSHKIKIDQAHTSLKYSNYKIKLQKGPLFIFELEESGDMSQFIELQKMNTNHLFFCRIS